jgi:hypothetical protein
MPEDGQYGGNMQPILKLIWIVVADDKTCVNVNVIV